MDSWPTPCRPLVGSWYLLDALRGHFVKHIVYGARQLADRPSCFVVAFCCGCSWTRGLGHRPSSRRSGPPRIKDVAVESDSAQDAKETRFVESNHLGDRPTCAAASRIERCARILASSSLLLQPSSVAISTISLTSSSCPCGIPIAANAVCVLPRQPIGRLASPLQ